MTGMTAASVKKFGGVLLQMAVTAGALAYVLHDPEKRAHMAAALRAADWRWLAAGLGTYGGVEALAVLRWQTLLRIQGFRIGWGRAAAILFISEFFLLFTPGLVGGDAMRVYYLIRDAPDKKLDALTAVLMDRIMGMLSLIVMAGVILTARFDWLDRSPVGLQLVRVVALILACGAAALLTSLLAMRFGWLARLPLPRSLRDLGEAFRQFGRDWPRTVGAFATTLASHWCYYVSFCFAALALRGVSQPAPAFWDVFSVMPIENTLTALPISLAGIGLRESLFESLLHSLSGVPPAVGALIGSLGFSMKALWSLPGAAVFLGYRLVGRASRPHTVEDAELSTPMDKALAP